MPENPTSPPNGHDPLPISKATGRPMKGKPSLHKKTCNRCKGKGFTPAGPEDSIQLQCEFCKGSGKVPYRKITNAEMEIRIEKLTTLLGKSLKKHEIREFCAKEWGVSWRHADRYLASASLMAIKRSGRSKDDLRIEAVAFYEDVLRSGRATVREKSEARRELNEIYGLYAPRGIRVADEQGKPLAGTTVLAPIVNLIMPDNHRGLVTLESGNGKLPKPHP